MGQGPSISLHGILQMSDIAQDLMRKEYMGEITIPIVDWFHGEDVKLWDDQLPVSFAIFARRGEAELAIAPHPPPLIDSTAAQCLRYCLLTDWIPRTQECQKQRGCAEKRSKRVYRSGRAQRFGKEHCRCARGSSGTLAS